MYAVIKTGGKQYRVAPGDEISVEKLDAEVGEDVTLPAVMLVADSGEVTIGGDVDGESVTATVVEHGRGKKIRVFTYKNKTRQRRRKGHRQAYTKVRIDSVPSGS